MNNGQTSKSPIMTVKDIAKYLGIHEMTVYRLAKEKKIPTFKVGGQVRTFKVELDKYLISKCVERA